MKSFSQAANLTAHVRTHSGEKVRKSSENIYKSYEKLRKVIKKYVK